MKKYLFVLAAIAATFVSCQKNENITPEVKGVPMTLKATIAQDPSTKVTYTPGATSGLKTEWEATESISVVTLSASGEFLSADTFTSTGAAGRAEASFTGTFTGGATPAKVIVIYPALENYSAGYYGTPEYTRFDGATIRLVSDIYNDGADKYSATQLARVRQSADNNTNHLQNIMLMVGTADIDDIKTGTLTTTLNNQLSIIKFKCTFDAGLIGQTINSITIESKNQYDVSNSIFSSVGPAWDNMDLAGNPISFIGVASLNTAMIYADFAVPASCKATLYLPILIKNDVVATDKWEITVQVNDANRPTVTKTFTANKSFDRGKIYTISVDVN